MKHLDEIFQDIMARGGEGIILRDPSAFYQAGRSPGYLKHKVSYSHPPFAFYCLLALQLCIEIQGRRSQDCRSGGTTPMGMWAVRVAFPLFLFIHSICFPVCLHRPNGVRFVAEGTTELSNRWNPQVGDVVSFKHRGFLLATKRPKIPTLYRLRPDLTWQDVLDNWKEHKSISHGTLKSSPPPPNNHIFIFFF